MIIQINIGILGKYTMYWHRYADNGKISAAILNDSSVTIAMAMLFDESFKLTH